MNDLRSHAGSHYSPLYFLAALGLGGASVSFFMYLLFWVPHPGQPVPVFEDIATYFQSGGLAVQAMIAIAVVGIAVFTVLHMRMLIWNLRQLTAFKRTDAYTQMRGGNTETQLMAVPLTLAMSINTLFIAGLVFVPGLWSLVEYLFPAALIAFLILGWYAFSIMGDFFGRIMTKGGFDCARNNSFAQLLPAFAFAMIGVGLAAPAAMSETRLVVALSFMASTLFIAAAVILAGIKIVLGLRAMMENGASDEGAPTLWILIPIMTVVGIASLRQSHGLHQHFGLHGTPADNFTLLWVLVSVQILFGLLGYRILRAKRYFSRFVFGKEKSPGSYALICPGIAFVVLGHFFINKGLVATEIITKFGPAFWTLSGILVALQVVTIAAIFRLNAAHFRTVVPPRQAATAS